jgi:predicted MPP superfamily phosphohydrolase
VVGYKYFVLSRFPNFVVKIFDNLYKDIRMRGKKTILSIFFTIILGLGIYGLFIEPDEIEVHHLWVNDSILGKTMKGMTAIQISDLHISKIGRREEKVLKIIDDIKPDIIFLTGDYVRWDGDYKPALDYLSRLKAKIGVWAVMGDYDYSNSRKSCLFCHREGTGEPTQSHMVRFLRNSSDSMTLPDGHMKIYGIDIEEEDDKDKKIDERGPAIILCHSPLGFDRLDNNSDVLMLSGDTHGGQVPLPGWFWNLLGYEKNAKYSQGLYREGQKMMYVSRGIGTSHIPIRIFRRPEVVVLHF